MADPITVTDLENATLDVTTIAETAMVGTDADTTTNREGKVLDTLQGRLNKLGFEPPVAYTAGITFTDSQDAAKTLDESGVIYACLASSRPFTTTGNFANDLPNFFIVQDTGATAVYAESDNTFTGDNSFQGAIGTAQYLIDTGSTPFSSGVVAEFPVVFGDSGYYEYEFIAKGTNLTGSGDLFIESGLSSGAPFSVTHAGELLFNQGSNTEQDSLISTEPNVISTQILILPTATTDDFTLTAKGVAYFSASDAGNAIEFIVTNNSGTIAGNITGVYIKTRKLTPANVTLI